MSSRVLGLAGLLRFCASQSLGTMQGNSQHKPADQVGIRIILDRVDEGGKRDVLAKALVAVGVEDEGAGQARVIGREDREDRRVDRQEMAARALLGEELGVEPRADGVERIAAGHAKGDRLVAGYLAQEVDAAEIGAGRLGEIVVSQ